MVTKKEMFNEILTLSPKLIELTFKNIKPTHKDVREALRDLKNDIKKEQEEYDESIKEDLCKCGHLRNMHTGIGCLDFDDVNNPDSYEPCPCMKFVLYTKNETEAKDDC